MSEDSTRLRETVELLQKNYDAVRRRLSNDKHLQNLCITPEMAQDPNGRYILLDALTTLVSAQTVLRIVEAEIVDG